MTDLVPTLENDAAKLRCVLVHGTNARDAPWTQSTSPLARELARLEPDGVAFYKYLWSGANSHEKRAEAAAVLRERLAREVLAYPEASFLLVGHSHGGNVICRAADAIPRDRLVGVVCMATPFFHVRARDLYPLRWAFAGVAMFKMLLILLALAGFAWLMNWAVPSFVEWKMKSYLWLAHTGLAGRVVVLVCFLYPLGLYFLAAFHHGFAAEKSPSFVSRVQSLNNWARIRPTAVPTLCLWHGPDEPYWGLKIIRYSGEYAHGIVGILAKIGFPLLLVSSIVAAAWWGFLMAPTDSGYSLWTMTLLRVALSLGLAGAAMFVVPTLLWFVGVLTSTLSRLLYGKVSVAEHLWLDIGLKRFPDIDKQLISRGPLTLGTGSVWDNIAAVLPVFVGQLVHSKVYVDTGAAVAIKVWYKKRIPVEESRRRAGLVAPG